MDAFFDVVISLEMSNNKEIIFCRWSFTPVWTTIRPIIDNKFCWILTGELVENKHIRTIVVCGYVVIPLNTKPMKIFGWIETVGDYFVHLQTE